jgi:deoxyadenosine/deoxycytidine kinase
MSILLFDKVCLFDSFKNETTIYGQYNKKFDSIFIDNIIFELVFCKDRPDFYIKLKGKINKLEKIIFNNQIQLENINLHFYCLQRCHFLTPLKSPPRTHGI